VRYYGIDAQLQAGTYLRKTFTIRNRAGADERQGQQRDRSGDEGWRMKRSLGLTPIRC
jgi:hypothetical protein